MKQVPLFVLLIIFALFTGFSFGQAIVTVGETPAAYGSGIPGEYKAFGATDLEFLQFYLNLVLGCGPPVPPVDAETIRIHDVSTPSDNILTSAHGPMVHVVWLYSDDPCVDDPLTWGYGSFSVSVQDKANQGPSSRYTASAALPDDPDWCEGDLLNYTAIWSSKANGGQGMRKIILSCPED